MAGVDGVMIGRGALGNPCIFELTDYFEKFVAKRD